MPPKGGGGDEEEEEEDEEFLVAPADSAKDCAPPNGLREILARNPQFVSKHGFGRIAVGTCGQVLALCIHFCETHFPVDRSMRAVAGLGLGISFAVGMFGAWMASTARPLFLWVALLATFPWLELFITCAFHPDTVSFNGTCYACAGFWPEGTMRGHRRMHPHPHAQH
jgi:hypothetical protein